MVRIPQPTLPKIAQGRDQLVALFAQTDHQAGLGGNVRCVTTRALEQLESARVAAARPGHAVQPRHGLGVVVEHVRSRIEHGTKRLSVPLKIWNQHLDPAVGDAGAGFTNRRREDRRATVGQIVTIHRGDDDVLEAERGDGIGHAAGLGGVHGSRPAVGNRAI